MQMRNGSISPNSTEELARRFPDAAQVDYIVLPRAEIFTRYYEDWSKVGIDEPRAERLQLPTNIEKQFVVYRWHRGKLNDDNSVARTQ